MAIIVDSYPESNYAITKSLDGNTSKIAQSFTSDGEDVSACKFYLEKYGSPTGNITAVIYEHSGTFGTSSVPTSSVLGTSDVIDASTIGTSMALVEFTFSTPVSLSSGTNYCISIEYSDGDPSNRLNIGYDNSSPTHSGNAAWYVSSWVSQSSDIIFYVYGATIIDSYSDSGSSTTVSNTQGYAQSFTSNGYDITNVQIKLGSKTASPTGSAYIGIYAHSGTYGTSSIPTASELATSNALDVSTITTSLSGALYNFNFSTPLSTTDGDYYVLVLYFSGTNFGAVNKVSFFYDATAPTHDGNYSSGIPPAAFNPQVAYDLTFYVSGYTPLGSTSPSVSESPSPSPSVSDSQSESTSPSVSESDSPSVSESQSESTSPSVSESVSPSVSESASPSSGTKDYTREAADSLPSDDTDLETTYSAQDITDVGTENDTRVGQLAQGEYALHQYKDYVGSETSATLHWEGQTTYAPSTATVYLQIYKSVVDSYPETNADGYTSCISPRSHCGQTFKPTITSDITSAQFLLAATATGKTGDLYVEVYAHTGTFGTDGVPTGSALGTSDAVNISTIPAFNETLVTFTFSTPVAVTAGIPYCIGVKANDSAESNFIRVFDDDSSPTHEGNWWSRYNTSYTSGDFRDAIFYVYYSSGVWENVDSDNTTAVNTDFVLTYEVADLSDYKDNEMISCRIYQEMGL